MKIADGSDDFGGDGGGGSAAAAAAAAAAVAFSPAPSPVHPTGGTFFDQFCAIIWRRWLQASPRRAVLTMVVNVLLPVSVAFLAGVHT